MIEQQLKFDFMTILYQADYASKGKNDAAWVKLIRNMTFFWNQNLIYLTFLDSVEGERLSKRATNFLLAQWKSNKSIVLGSQST